MQCTNFNAPFLWFDNFSLHFILIARWMLNLEGSLGSATLSTILPTPGGVSISPLDHFFFFRKSWFYILPVLVVSILVNIPKVGNKSMIYQQKSLEIKMNNYFGAVSGSWDLLGRRHQCHWNPKRWGVAYLSSSSNSLSSTCHVTFIFYDSPPHSRMLQLSTSQSTFQITGFNLIIQNSRILLATMFLLKDNHWSSASDQQSLEWMRPI